MPDITGSISPKKNIQGVLTPQKNLSATITTHSSLAMGLAVVAVANQKFDTLYEEPNEENSSEE